ncbi:MAG TPA: HAD-IA family hydrolase [Xanthobacteraceae bacterium]
MGIFDCNGVLVDSEPIAAAVAARELAREGITLTPQFVSHYFFGRRPAEMIATIEAAARRKLPTDFDLTVTAETLKSLRAELRAMAHASYALSWLRGPKCVASSSPIERIRLSLELAGLTRFFEPHLFSASDVPNGKPAPGLFRLVAQRMKVAPRDCIVVEDSPVGVAAATAAGMVPIGFVGGSHAGAGLGQQLLAAGAHDHRRHAPAQKHDRGTARLVNAPPPFIPADAGTQTLPQTKSLDLAKAGFPRPRMGVKMLVSFFDSTFGAVVHRCCARARRGIDASVPE